MEPGWIGHCPSTLKQHSSTGQGVQAFHVDEHDGLILSSTQQQLIVSELSSPGEILWAIKMEKYSRFIYGQGYLLLEQKRPVGVYDVWRRRSDDSDSDSGASVGTLNEARRPSTTQVIDVPGTIAYFVPWTVITTEHTFTCVNGALGTEVTSSVDDEVTTVHLWDLRSGTRMLSYDHLHHKHPDFSGPIRRAQIESMAYTDDFIFVVRENSFQAFFRNHDACVVDWSGKQQIGAKWVYKIGKEEGSGIHQNSLMRPHRVTSVYQPNEKRRMDWDAFIRVRVAPCGTIVYVTRRCGIYVIFDFDQVALGKARIEDKTLEIRMADTKLFATDSCLSAEGQFAVTSAMGIFVIGLDWSEIPSPSAPRRADGQYLRHVHVSRAVCFSDSEALIRQTNVRITSDGLYATWFPEASTKHSSIKISRGREDFLISELCNGLVYPNYPSAKGNTATLYSLHVAIGGDGIYRSNASPSSSNHRRSLLSRMTNFSWNAPTSLRV